MNNYEILDLSDKLKWAKYLEYLPRDKRDIYFTPDYYELHQINGEGKALCFVYNNNKDLALYPFLRNYVPPFFTSDRQYFDIQGAYGYNGVVSTTDDRSFINNFYLLFDQYCFDTNIVAEFTRFHPLLDNFKFSQDNMIVLDDRKTVVVNLESSMEEIWKSCFSSNNRNMIRKAEKNNITVEVAEAEIDYNAFIEIYHETMENVSAADFYFFNNMYFQNFKKLLGKNHKLLVAKYDGQIICAMLLMFKDDYAHYHLSGRRTAFSKLAANNIMLYEAIKVSKKLGCKYFHLGGGTSAHDDDHLLKFKANFSKNFTEFKIGKKIHNNTIYKKIVKQWERENPDKIQSKLLLKYRE